MCEISLDNVEMLKNFGLLFTLGGIASVATGTTYYRGFVHRAEQPLDFWIATVGLLLIGGLTLLGLQVCPRV